jgi:hypothetical protein
MLLKELEFALRNSWDAKTCYPPQRNEWSSELPEVGQCAVTALIVQNHFGGKIAYNESLDHFWNILPSGEELDFTSAQFGNNPAAKIDDIISPRTILNSEGARKFMTKKRYLHLRDKVNSILKRKAQLSLAY